MGVQDRVWTPDRARREGVPYRRLTAGRDFVRVVPGHYVEGVWAHDLLTRCAAVVAAVPGGVVSHWTALELRGYPVPLGQGGTIHVSVPVRSDRRVRGARVHRLLDPAVPLPGDVPVSGPGRAWCDAATLLESLDSTTHPREVRPSRSTRPLRRSGDLTDLVAALDVLLGREPGVAPAVRRHLRARPGQRGTALAQLALTLADPRAESAQESRVRVLLALAGLAPPAVQHVVRTAGGGFVARVDLAWPSQRVALEYDGEHHRTREQWRADLARRERLELLGWRVVVVVAADLRRPDLLVERVGSALRRAAA